jgi:hypothetical protein
MGLLPLNYRRPSYVTGSPRTMSDDQMSVGSGGSVGSGSANGSNSLKATRSVAVAGIPDALTFDRIIDGGTCPVSSFDVSWGNGPH